MLSDASDRDQSLLRCHVWVDKLFEEWRSMKATSAKMMEREHKRKSETGKMDILKANTNLNKDFLCELWFQLHLLW